MKVAIFAHRFPSLSETFVADQVRALRERGVEVHVYANVPESDQPLPDGLPVTHWIADPARRLVTAEGLPVLRRLRARLALVGDKRADRDEVYSRCSQLLPPQRYDAILAHFGTVGIEADRLRRCGVLRGPLFVVFHGFDITRELKKRGPEFYKRLLKRANYLMPISERWRTRLVELGARRERLIVHRMGVRCDEIDFRPRSFSPGSPLRVVSIARLVEKKGLKYGIRALSKLAESGQPVSYDIVGGGPLQEELEAEAQACNFPVHFHGPGDHDYVWKVLGDAHIALAPSVTAENGDQEGIPVAIMEAMAAGLPVVATRHSGIPELVRDGENGYLAEEGSVPSLLEKLQLCCHEHDSWQRMLRAARDTVEMDFNQAKLHERLIEHLTPRRRKGWLPLLPS